MDGETKACGAYDSLMAQWTNDGRLLVLCSDLASLITSCTLWKKSYYTNDSGNIRIPIIEKDVFSFKGLHSS